jgi:GNAT superfamily N-acetyltransferase
VPGRRSRAAGSQQAFARPDPGICQALRASAARPETYLIAWVDGIPAGTGEILWQGCAAPEVTQRFPRCPELNGLQVWPAERQSHGIGTAIIRAAEARARERGYRQIGLGVADDNPRAAALYLRLGYHETGCRYLDRYHYLDDRGRRHDVADPARFLVKQLQPSPDTG